jgi:hypothetical protein
MCGHRKFHTAFGITSHISHTMKLKHKRLLTFMVCYFLSSKWSEFTMHGYKDATISAPKLTPPDTQPPVRLPNSLYQSSTKLPVWRLSRLCLSFNFSSLSVDGMTCIVYRFVANEMIYRMVRITAQSVSYFRL